MSLPRRHLAGRDTSNVDVTAFLSLLVILVPFLLITAVFSRMTILELEGASGAQASAASSDPLALQVVVRAAVIEVRHQGQPEPTRLVRSPEGAEYQALAELAADLKRRHPQSSAVTLLVEPQIAYEDLIQVMDAVRVKPQREGDSATYMELFSAITVGETATVRPGGGRG